MFDKVLQLAIFLLLAVRSKARQEDVIHQPLVQVELEPDGLVLRAPGAHHHQVGGLRPDEGSSPLSLIRNVLQ